MICFYALVCYLCVNASFACACACLPNAKTPASPTVLADGTFYLGRMQLVQSGRFIMPYVCLMLLSVSVCVSDVTAKSLFCALSGCSNKETGVPTASDLQHSGIENRARPRCTVRSQPFLVLSAALSVPLSFFCFLTVSRSASPRIPPVLCSLCCGMWNRASSWVKYSGLV